MIKFLNSEGLKRLVALIKQALGGKQDTLVSGSNIKTVNDNSLLGSGNLRLNDAAIPYDGNGAYALEDATNVQEALDILDDAVNGLDIPPHVVVNEDPTGGSQAIQNPELLNKIESITTTESTASGGSNTVTITETNGTTTSFNVKNGTDGRDGVDGQDGADGVSLGEVALVQTTGDSEESVMSQKAVTEYGRKVTAEDLAGTSDWIKARLTEEGWEFDKYLNSSGNLENATGYCVSPYIPISGVEHKNIWFYGGEFTSGSYTTCVYNGEKTKLTYLAYTKKPREYSFGKYSTSIAYIRTTFKMSDIAACYIYNNTDGQYLLKMEEYLIGIFNEKGLNVSSKFLEEYIINQEPGESTIKTMSQKAITDSINYNVSIEKGTGFTLNSNTNVRYFKLTPKATTLLNASDKMSFMFSTKGTGGNADYRYFQFGNGSTSSNATDTNGACLMWSFSRDLSANGVSYTLNQTGSNQPTPDVWIVTWDRINGIVKFYDHTTLVNTLSGDNYKKDRFVNDNGLMCLRGGDNNVRIYDIRLFDYDISYLFGYSDISNEIKNLEGAGILPSQFLNNYNHSNGLFMTETNNFQGGGYSATCTYSLDGDDYHIVVKDNVTSTQECGGKPYYLGIADRAQLEKLEFEVVSGVIKHCWRNNQQNENLNYRLIIDENGDEIADYDNIGVGKYTLIKTQAANGFRLNFYKVSGNVEVVMNRVMQYRPISCVFHLRGDMMYNKKFYDDQTDSFITLYSDRTCVTEYTTHTMVMTPQRVIRTEIISLNGLPHYAGEMAVVGNNVYIGMADYTWKQINNS